MIRLDRPELPVVARRARWPGVVVAVFGRDAGAFADRMVERARERSVDARVVRVELRHREGSDVRGERDLSIACAPDALASALASVRDHAALTVGVGLAFAAAVESDLSVWIRARESALALPEAERALATGARLVLEGARPSLADALVERLIGAGSRSGAGL